MRPNILDGDILQRLRQESRRWVVVMAWFLIVKALKMLWHLEGKSIAILLAMGLPILKFLGYVRSLSA
jgi:RsiW-degrading membrane proteinase PrsW (M82 family)